MQVQNESTPLGTPFVGQFTTDTIISSFPARFLLPFSSGKGAGKNETILQKVNCPTNKSFV